MNERDILELKINDAVDGLLSEPEIDQLKSQLEKYPDLQETFNDVMNLPDFAKAYPIQEHEPAITALKQEMISQETRIYFLSGNNILKYAAAIAIMIFMTSTYLFISNPSLSQEREVWDTVWMEVHQPAGLEQDDTETYLGFLDNFLGEE